MTEAECRAIIERAYHLRSTGSDSEADDVLSTGLSAAQASGSRTWALALEAQLAWARAQYDRASAIQGQALQLEGESALLLRCMGIICADGGSEAEALEWIDRALAVDPDDYVTVRSRGTALARLDRYEEALEWFDRSLALKPDDYAAMRNRGATLGDLGRLEEALEWYDRALAHRPGDVAALTGRGVTLGMLGRASDALEWFDRALAVRSGDYQALGNRGIALSVLGRDEEALEWFDRALDVKPDGYEALRDRGVSLAKLGRADEALQCLDRALALKPDDDLAQLWRMRVLPGRDAQEQAKRLEEQQQRRERARELQEAKLEAWRSLSARAAHRIGNQTFAALGAIDALRGSSDPQVQECADELAGLLANMNRVMGEFRRFRKHAPARPGEVDLDYLLTQVAARHRAAHGPVAVVHAESVGRLPARADAQQLGEALDELIENAVQMMPSGGQIRLSVERVARRARMVVEDTGPGVPIDQKALIFEPFVSARAGGTGLGLAIVKQLVENQKGSIRETGRPGHGARFEVDLPILEEDGGQ